LVINGARGVVGVAPFLIFLMQPIFSRLWRTWRLTSSCREELMNPLAAASPGRATQVRSTSLEAIESRIALRTSPDAEPSPVETGFIVGSFIL
jgi:hypothetical protein